LEVSIGENAIILEHPCQAFVRLVPKLNGYAPLKVL
jgi:hypothetical protein